MGGRRRRTRAAAPAGTARGTHIGRATTTAELATDGVRLSIGVLPWHDVERLTAEDRTRVVRELFPLLNPDNVYGATWTPTDGYVDRKEEKRIDRFTQFVSDDTQHFFGRTHDHGDHQHGQRHGGDEAGGYSRSAVVLYDTQSQRSQSGCYGKLAAI